MQILLTQPVEAQIMDREREIELAPGFARLGECLLA